MRFITISLPALVPTFQRCLVLLTPELGGVRADKTLNVCVILLFMFRPMVLHVQRGLVVLDRTLDVFFSLYTLT